jgi:hypothetical protein
MDGRIAHLAAGRLHMVQPVSTPTTYRFLTERFGSSYRELFVCGTSLRAQSLISDMENESLAPEQIAAAYHIPVEAVLEAAAYVHQNEEYLAGERSRTRQQAIAKGYLRPTP